MSKKDLVVVNINQGLGNKMFHYAFGRGLRNKGFNVFYDLTPYTPTSPLPHELIQLKEVFPQIDLPIIKSIKLNWKSPRKKKFFKVLHKIDNIIYRIINKLHGKTYFIEYQYGFIPNIEKKIKGKYFFRGNWQSEKYFKNCQEDILKQFTFLPFDEPKNIELVKKMQQENSVAIHIRKGKDYEYPMFQGICDIDYYNKAIEYIQQKIENPVFYVFTDNPEWVRQNLLIVNYYLVNWNTNSVKRSFRDMQLMTYVKHNIIANSTYSWWGAWLNPNPNKIVISPKIFFNPVSRFLETSDIIPDSWIKIK